MERSNRSEGVDGHAERLEALFDNSINAIAFHEIVTDDEGEPVDYVFLAVNPAFETMTGLAADEVIGRRVTEVLPGIEEEPWIEIYGKVALDGETTRFVRYAETLDRHYQVTAFPLAERRFAAVFMDVTRQVRFEEELQEEQRLLERILKASPDRFVLYDEDDRIRFISDASLASLGRERHDVVGKRADELGLPKDLIGRLDEQRRAVRESGAAATHRMVFPTVAGERDYEYTLSPVEGRDGEVVGVLSTVRDVTERVELEERFRQASKLEAIGRLAGGIAHDFNNILTGINGFTSMLLSRLEEGDAMRRDVEEIRALAERAADLTRQLLAFSRRQSVDLGPEDINRLIERTSRLLRRVIGEDIDLRLDLEEDLPSVRADRVQLEQVLLNLAVNARDAMVEGGVLEISTRREPATDDDPEEGERWIVIEVRDEGEGMDEAILEKIFEPFFTTKDVGKGTGLGLSTAYGIVEQHGGEIRVRSHPGEGTAFEIRLPAVDPSTVSAEIDETMLTRPRVSTGTVLVVEDEESVRHVACRSLEAAGFTVLAAADADEAERRFRSHDGTIDLLVTDIVMPGRDGVTLHEELTALQADLPVLFISGYPDRPSDDRDGSLPGALLHKPFDPAALQEKVREALARD